MISEKSVIIITGNSKRHLYFVSGLEKHFRVLKVISEVKFDYKEAYKQTIDSEIVNSHFNLREKSEVAYFGAANPRSELLKLDKGLVNTPGIVKMLTKLNADLVLLFGASIIKNPLLEHYSDKVINLHLGLSPYYRGSGTNFWPLVDGRPECVGATIHIAIPKVDAGSVLHQIRPEMIIESDSIHDLGNKTVITAIQVLPRVLKAYLEHRIEPSAQIGFNKQEYKRLDLNSESIKKAYANIENGLVKEYLNHRLERNKSYPIIEFKLNK